MPPASLPGAAASPSSPPPFAGPPGSPWPLYALCSRRGAKRRSVRGQAAGKRARSASGVYSRPRAQVIPSWLPFPFRTEILSREGPARSPRRAHVFVAPPQSGGRQNSGRLHPASGQCDARRLAMRGHARLDQRRDARCSYTTHVDSLIEGAINDGPTPRTRCTRSTNLPNWNFGTLCFIKDTKVVPPHEPSRLFAVPGKACQR